MEQVVRLKRSEKTYLAGKRAIFRKIEEEIKELKWFDKNIELLKDGKTQELKTLWVIVR